MLLGENKTPQRPWWRPGWYEFVPEIALAAGLTWFLIDEPDAATSALKSTRAIGIMAAAAAVWIAGRVVLARFLLWRSARTFLFGLAAIGALAVVVLPAYNDTTVIEAFPLTAAEATDGERSATTLSPTTNP